MTTGRPGGPGLWRNRDFLLLLSGQGVSYLGNQVQSLALPLVVLAITGSVAQAGLVIGLNGVSFLVFGLLAGAVVDRWDRKAIMIWCELGRGLLTVSVVVGLWLGALTMPQLYLVAVLTGILTTVFQVADTASLPNVVGPEQLSTALGYMQSGFNTIRIGGAALAGAIYSVGQIAPFAANAFSFGVSAVTLRFMRAQFQRERPRAAGPARRGALAADIREGLRWVWSQPAVRFLTCIQSADSVRYGAGYLVIVTLARGLGASAMQIGLIFGGAAVGALAGSLASGRAINRFAVGKIAITMLWVEALMFPLYAIAPSPLLLGCVAAAESVVAPVYAVAMTSYRLSITPDNVQGRVTSAVSTLTTGAASLGAIIGGTVLAALGPRHTVLVWGGWLTGLALITTASRAVRRAPRAAGAGPPAADSTADPQAADSTVGAPGGSAAASISVR
jgi:MFS family permease